MGFVTVSIIDPDGNEYEADVDEKSNEQDLLKQLISEIPLPKSEEYEIFFNTTGIKDNTIIRIERKAPKLVKDIRKK
jgi:hypothetical protein